MLLIQSTEQHFSTTQSIMPGFSHVYQQMLFNTKWSICPRKCLKFLEGTTRGETAAMAIYSLVFKPLLVWLSNLSKEKTERFPSRQVAFADDLNGVGSLENLKK